MTTATNNNNNANINNTNVNAMYMNAWTGSVASLGEWLEEYNSILPENREEEWGEEDFNSEGALVEVEEVFSLEPQWGEPMHYSSFDEMEEEIRELCELNAHNDGWAFPEDGLQEGRDYTIEWREVRH